MAKRSRAVRYADEFITLSLRRNGALFFGGRVSMKPLKSGDPARIGGIVLRGRLGEGGMGTVYFGITPDGDRVAVKTIRQDLTTNDEARDRFDREILALGMVAGPRI